MYIQSLCSLFILHFFLILYSQFPVFPRIPSSNSHPRRHSHEAQGFQCHSHIPDYRKFSADESRNEPLESKRRSHSKIQAFPESFEQQLCFRTKRSASLVCNRIVEYLTTLKRETQWILPPQL